MKLNATLYQQCCASHSSTPCFALMWLCCCCCCCTHKAYTHTRTHTHNSSHRSSQNHTEHTWRCASLAGSASSTELPNTCHAPHLLPLLPLLLFLFAAGLLCCSTRFELSYAGDEGGQPVSCCTCDVSNPSGSHPTAVVVADGGGGGGCSRCSLSAVCVPDKHLDMCVMSAAGGCFCHFDNWG